MIISLVHLKNWRNFIDAEAILGEVTYILGANASGKSNFLDVFRFLRDIAKPDGGGLQKAIKDRGGLAKVRCLHARRDPLVLIEIELSEKSDDATPVWKYILELKSEGSGLHRPVVSREEVYAYENGKPKAVLMRPNEDDDTDKERLTQTSLEQIQANKEFRTLVDSFSAATYLHLVPQLIKYGEQIGGRQMESDPFGQAFMERIAKTHERTRNSRLTRIQSALARVVPHFGKLEFEKDDAGKPHLKANYKHHRPNGGWQREDQFSDGTLRLIALFWVLLDGDDLLLLEEPELSLDESIVRQFPKMINELERSKKKAKRQIIISTHSDALLDEKAIDARFVLRLEQDQEGTKIVSPTDADKALIKDGFSPAEVILRKVHPRDSGQMVLI